MIKLDEINIHEALRYMCAAGTDDPILLQKVKTCAAELLKVIKPVYTHKIFPLEHSENGILLSGTNLLLTGNSAREHFSGCHSVILMAATLSGFADRYIQTAEITDMAKALIADSLCTAAIEQVCDIAEREIISSLPKENHYTWRFSAGYGDLPLDIQPLILRILNTEKIIGLTINDSLIMLPRKSVTAFIGISDKPIEQKRKGCAACTMCKSCTYRQKGTHCGQ
ncbi:MAG: methionine synthase [Firmicutes bacterium]|nr:methionine synthase [Bacillota bacterium]